MSPPKLVLAVIDGCNPEMLERAIELGRAPALAAIAERGSLVAGGAASAFPSVTQSAPRRSRPDGSRTITGSPG